MGNSGIQPEPEGDTENNDVFRTVPNIYDRAFLQKMLTAYSRELLGFVVLTELHHKYFPGF